MRWAGHLVWMEGDRNAFKIVTSIPTGKRSLGRPRHRWEDNIRMDLKEIGINMSNWVDSAWFLHHCFDISKFPPLVLFIDEARITSESCHNWNDKNPNATYPSGFQQLLDIIVWAVIIDGHQIELYMLVYRLMDPRYLIFMKKLC